MRDVVRSGVFGLLLGTSLLVPGAPGQSDALEDLARKIQPGQDDWVAEAAQDRARVTLSRLTELLKSGTATREDLAPLVAPDARASALFLAEGPGTSLTGGTSVLRAPGKPLPPDRSALDALVAWAERGSGAHRVKFKVVKASKAANDRLSTRVRCEVLQSLKVGAVQETSTWLVTWTLAGEEPRISRLSLASFERVTRTAPLLTECTASVLRRVADPALTRGGDAWYGRMDAVGESILMGHQGLAVGDFNGDGLPDLYVPMGTGLPNRLLVQQADGSVRDVAGAAGVAWLDDTKGALFADMDNDGDQDLLMTLGPVIVLAKNDGKGGFDRFVSMRAPTPAGFYSIAVADYDLDGDLDIFGCRYVKLRYGVSVPMPFEDARNGPSNHLLRNDGEDRFTDVTKDVGLDAGNTRFSLAASWADYDGDGDPDLYVANDFGRNNLWRNDDGRFVDVAKEAGVEDQAAGMGVSWADFDGDGHLDLYVTNMFSAAGNRIAYQSRFEKGKAAEDLAGIRRHSLGNSLFRNRGDGTFEDVSARAGVRMGRWGWGARWVDLNNDGHEDIVAPNGFLTGRRPDDL